MNPTYFNQLETRIDRYSDPLKTGPLENLIFKIQDLLCVQISNGRIDCTVGIQILNS